MAQVHKFNLFESSSPLLISLWSFCVILANIFIIFFFISNSVTSNIFYRWALSWTLNFPDCHVLKNNYNNGILHSVPLLWPQTNASVFESQKMKRDVTLIWKIIDAMEKRDVMVSKDEGEVECLTLPHSVDHQFTAKNMNYSPFIKCCFLLITSPSQI